jgi:hypothetical protein
MIRIKPSTTVVCLSISRACKQALTTDITLTLWRAGCWPQYKTVCEQVDDECGCRTVTKRVEVWPVRIQYKATHVNDAGMACFTLDSKFLSLSGGRYDGKVETPCGKADLKFYKDGPIRVTGHSTVEDVCAPLCGPVDECEPSPGVAGCPPPAPVGLPPVQVTFRCVDPETFSECDGFVEALVPASYPTDTYEILWTGNSPQLIGTFVHTQGTATTLSQLLSVLSGNPLPAVVANGGTTITLRRQSDFAATNAVLPPLCCR